MCPVPSEILLSPEHSATPSPLLLFAVLQDTVLFQASKKNCLDLCGCMWGCHYPQDIWRDRRSTKLIRELKLNELG